VAIIGASGDTSKTAARPQRYLRSHGFRGRIHPINRHRTTVLGEPAFPDLRSAPVPIDHVFVATSDVDFDAIIDDCLAVGARCATILSGGFADAGATGRERQARLVARARAGGLRILGPNSMGVVHIPNQVVACANATLEMERLPAGRLGLISQSGSALGMVLSRGAARGFGFSALVSVGNEGDLGVGELGQLLIDDPHTDAILLFLETIRGAHELEAMARRAFREGKSVVAFKLGRSDVGQQLSASHTGALASSDDVVDAFFAECGIVRVSMLEALLEAPALLAGRKPPAGRSVGIVATAGGAAAIVADRLGESGIHLVPPSAKSLEVLASKGVMVAAAPIIDLTMAGTRADAVAAALQETLQTPAIDVAVAIVGSSAQFQADRAVQPLLDFTGGAKPLAVFLAPEAPESLARLTAAGLASFRTPESCAESIRAFLDWRGPAEIVRPSAERLEEVRQCLSAIGHAQLNEREAQEVFGRLGIRSPISEVIRLPLDPVWLGSGIGYPVVAKILSRDITHKTDIGGVALGLRDSDALRRACQEMLERVQAIRPEASLSGILVQPHVTGLMEAIVGFRRDPQLGPVVLVGAGGTLTEIYRDVVCRMAPVSLATAHEMIAGVRAFAGARGARGLRRGDLDAVAQAVQAMSDLAAVDSPRVIEAEINPLLVMPEGQGVIAVDGVLICHPGGTPKVHYERKWADDGDPVSR
jgi:acyl-CoA synthetase (NDP forming)